MEKTGRELDSSDSEVNLLEYWGIIWRFRLKLTVLVIATAILGRFLGHFEIVQITGKIYWLKGACVIKVGLGAPCIPEFIKTF